jgi:hypothetical protein
MSLQRFVFSRDIAAFKEPTVAVNTTHSNKIYLQQNMTSGAAFTLQADIFLSLLIA